VSSGLRGDVEEDRLERDTDAISNAEAIIEHPS
jgi:hypothetical protein